jgi:capsular polysaccharide biosynthesis protein
MNNMSVHASLAGLTVGGRYYLGRLLRHRRRAIDEVATARTVLSPPEVTRRRRPRLAPGHEQRIQSDSEGAAPEEIRRALLAQEVHHDATVAYTLRDVALHGAAYFCGLHKGDLYRSRRKVHFRPAGFDRAVLASTYTAARWFGHLLHDDLPLQLLARDLGPPIAHARSVYPHEPDYRRLFNVPAPAWHPSLFARELVVLVDYAQNASKRARYRTMRQAVPRPPAGAARTRVYVRRAGGPARPAENEELLIEALVRRGFEVIHKSVDPVERVLALCSRAVQIVGIDGSHMVPPLFLAPEDAEILFLVPSHRTQQVLWHVADALGLRTALYVGLQKDASSPLCLDVDDLVAFVEDGLR